MNRLFLLGLFSVLACSSFAQKIQGVYVGTIFSERNVIALEVNGNLVTGFVYTSEHDRFDFKGTYHKPVLTGTIQLDSSRRISVEGGLNGNSLTMISQDSSNLRMYRVHRVSPKVNMDMADLFSDHYDMLLLGEWETVRRTDALGNDITTSGKIINQYNLHGQGVGRLTGTPPILANRSYTPGSIPSQYFRWEIEWNTYDGQLSATEDHTPKGWTRDVKVNYTIAYSIKNDTLITNSAKGNLTYWRRK